MHYGLRLCVFMKLNDTMFCIYVCDDSDDAMCVDAISPSCTVPFSLARTQRPER